MLAMTPGFHTQTFVSEILRLTENEDKNRSHHNFTWLEKYSKGMYNYRNSNDFKFNSSIKTTYKWTAVELTKY